MSYSLLSSTTTHLTTHETSAARMTVRSVVERNHRVINAKIAGAARKVLFEIVVKRPPSLIFL